MQVIVRDGYKEAFTVELESFGKDVVSFGRHPESDIVLTSSIVSRVHGCFYLDNGVWHIKDLNSTNGIKYNNDKIQDILISVGDAARITSAMGHGDMVEFRFRQGTPQKVYNVSPAKSVNNNYTPPADNESSEDELQVLKEPKKVMGIVPKKYVERDKGDGFLKCPRCGNPNVQIIQETSTSGKDFHASSSCCGWIFLGPIGLLCGHCGKGKQMKTTSYWICNRCGNKFKV